MLNAPTQVAGYLNVQATLARALSITFSATLLLSAPLLNSVMPYTLPGGGLLAKLHPVTYSVIPLLALAMHARGRLFSLNGAHAFRAFAIFTVVICWLAIRNKGALAATIIDIHLVPTTFLIALSCLRLEQVRSLMRLVVWIAAFNVVIVALEFMRGTSLLPREGYEAYFRPAGLFAHPIASATIFYVAMFLASRGVVSPKALRPLMALFLGGIVLCGVRGPLVVGSLIFLAHLVRPAIPRRTGADYLLDFGIAILAPVGFAFALYVGAFERIMAVGVWEESAQSRFSIFSALLALTNAEFWSGVSTYDAGEFLALRETGSKLVESFFVTFVFQAGFPIAFVMVAGIVILHWPAMRHSFIFAAMVIMVATTTLAFSSKNMIPLAIALAGYWVWRCNAEVRRGARGTGVRSNADY